MTQALAERIVEPVGPSPPVHPVAEYLNELHQKHVACTDGAVASYIPELSKADPNWFGIAVATIDGHVYEVGDTNCAFTIQSISKPFVYALALQDRGRDDVLAKVGVEPSGDAFNSISLYRDSGRPFNPMINAGAIASTGLVHANDSADRIRRILELCTRCAGRELAIDETVYRSERDTGFRNFAIGYMLRNFDILEGPPEPVLDAYFKQCSILVTCRDLAIMGATLANAGVCPITKQPAIDPRYVPQVLSVMASCGMYDYTGEWIYRIGMPSKSGVGGGIIGVLPGQMAIAVFSPPLDARGNSERGIRVFNDLSERFRMHMFQATPVSRYVVRNHYDAARVGSKRMRRSRETKILAEHGKRVAVYELQGDLTLFSAERVVREFLALPAVVDHLIVDFGRVLGAEVPALELWRAFVASASNRFREVIVTGLASRPALQAALTPSGVYPGFAYMHETDAALEDCEDRILRDVLPAVTATEAVRLEDFDVCEGLDPEKIARLRGVLQERQYRDADLILKRGDPAAGVFFLTRGQVSILVDLPGGGTRRLSTCTPGMLFGEMAILERRPRSATVRADGRVECYELPLASFDELTATDPELKVKLLQNFAQRLSVRLRKLSEEVSILGAAGS